MESIPIKTEESGITTTTSTDTIKTDDGIPRLDSTRSAHYSLNEDKDSYMLPIDPQGETKIDKNGRLLGDREYVIPTFTLVDRSEKLYMLATRVSKCLGIRDSTTLFNKYSTVLYKISLTNKDKMDLIERKVLPLSYKGRSINAITAASAYKVFGARVIKNGRKVTDDYYELEAISRGDIRGELAVDPELYGSISNSSNSINNNGNMNSGSMLVDAGSLISGNGRSLVLRKPIYSDGYFHRSAYSIAESSIYIGSSYVNNANNSKPSSDANSSLSTPVSGIAPILPIPQVTNTLQMDTTTAGINSAHITPSGSNISLASHQSIVALGPGEQGFNYEKFQVRSKLSKMILDEENWVFSHSLASRQHDLGLLYQRSQQWNNEGASQYGRRDSKLIGKMNTVRDPYTGTRFIPLSTQPKVSIWRRIDSGANVSKKKKKDCGKIEYKTILHCDGFVRQTGLLNVDDSIFEDVVSDEVKNAIMNQKRLERRSLCRKWI